jgi:hypothetical protein
VFEKTELLAYAGRKTKMADDVSRINTGRLRLFDRAVRGKSNKYTWSGLATLVVGLLILLVRMAFISAGYPLNVLIIGLGILLMLIGVIRLLIGFISPATPLDIIPTETPERSVHSDVLGLPEPQDE